MSLVKEFAIEPKVMATWSHFQSLWEDFGVGKGRLISKYPVLWSSKVDELAQQHSKPVQATAISAKIRRDGHKFLVKNRTYDRDMDWLANACAQMSDDPFHAIIACENPNGAAHVLIAKDFSKDEAPFQIATPNWNWIPRRAQDLANCASLLLKHCEEIRFVDKHFDPDTTGLRYRFKNTFRAMLALRNASAPKLRILEIHRARPKGFVPSALKAHYTCHLANMVPKGVTLRVFFWEERTGGLELHPRFLLTDLGGMNFENGLDEGEPGTETRVSLLEHEESKTHMNNYCQTSTAFDLGTDGLIEIQGKS